MPRLREAWARRELLWFLAVRDVKVRYAQTVMGAAWTIVQPVALMAVFTLAFRKIGRVETPIAYPVFALAGLTFWSFFSRSVTQGAESLVANSQLVTKTSSPRVLIPLSGTTSGLLDFGIALSFFFVFAGLFYGEVPGWELALLPAVTAFGILVILGPVLLLSALNAQYRDIRYVLPFSVQIWLFLSPVAYPIDVLGDPWSNLAALNPLVGVIDGFRWSLVGTSPPEALEILATVGVTLLLLLAGLLYFGKTERTLADRV
jgi:lipopolysaccharide transport system permease protein